MASLIPGFEYDIFISYRQKDNKGDRQGAPSYGSTQSREAGWVSEFVEGRDAMHCVSTATDTTTGTTTIIPNIPDKTANQFGPQSKNLASIIRGFKSSVTTQAKKSGNNDFAWQSRFHEHIIRNSAEFYKIRNYIINNPAIGDKDKFHD
jgi:hypothetical protein